MTQKTAARSPTSALDVLAPMKFIVPPADGAKPAFHSAALAGGSERFFFEVETRLVPIEDVRAWAEPPRVDREGFALLHHPTKAGDLQDDMVVDKLYRGEVVSLVADALGADEVVVFDVTRRSNAASGANNRDGARKPAGRIHVDYTEASGMKRAGDVLGRKHLEAALAAGKAIVQANVWRPIVGPVLSSPLALADARSIRDTALLATDQVFPDRVGEIYHLAYQPGQRFGYASEMTPDEVILIKGWDSRRDGRARLTPHAAFQLPGQDEAPARHSIEVRTFAIVPR